VKDQTNMPEAHQITYGQLRRLLLGIGFTEETVPGSQRVFAHAASGTIIVFGSHSDREIARRADVISTSRHLDEKGLLATEDFLTSLQAPKRPARR
jgi:predicted RNA binding protein YcfA (HicA-like mRNA interferase family)